MKVQYKLTLSLYADDEKRLQAAKQGDKKTREFEVTLLDRNGEIFSIPPGASAQYSISKPDGHTIVNLATVRADKIVFTLSEQALAAPGLVKGDVTLTLKDGAVLSSQRYAFECVKTDRDLSNVTSTSEYSAISDIVEEASGYKNEAAASAEAAKSFATAASASVDTVREIAAAAKESETAIAGHAKSAEESKNAAETAKTAAEEALEGVNAKVQEASERAAAAQTALEGVNEKVEAASSSATAAEKSATNAAESLRQAELCQKAACECSSAAAVAATGAEASKSAALEAYQQTAENKNLAEQAAASAGNTKQAIDLKATEIGELVLAAEGHANAASQAKAAVDASKAIAEQQATDAKATQIAAKESEDAAQRHLSETLQIKEGIITAEEARVAAERDRVAAEIARNDEEANRVTAELARVEAEQKRKAEATSDHSRAEADHAQHQTMIDTISKFQSGEIAATVADMQTNMATKEHVAAEFKKLIGAAPESLDTLGEIAAALNNEADFAATVVNELGAKASKTEVSEAITGLDNQLKPLIDGKASKLETDKVLAEKVSKTEYDTKVQELAIAIDTKANATDTNVAIAKKVNKTDYDLKVKSLEEGIAGKVAKITGKGLSSEDFTTAEKTKLAGIQEGAKTLEVINSLDSDRTDAALSPAQGKKLKTELDTHMNKTVASEAGAHGLRFHGEKLEYKAGALWTEIKTGGGSEEALADIQLLTTDLLERVKAL